MTLLLPYRQQVMLSTRVKHRTTLAQRLCGFRSSSSFLLLSRYQQRGQCTRERRRSNGEYWWPLNPMHYAKIFKGQPCWLALWKLVPVCFGVVTHPNYLAMAYNRSRSFAPKRYQAPRRRSYAKAPSKKRRMPASGRSFAANVEKANISSAPEKNISVCFSNMPLSHNKWSKVSNVSIKHFTSPVLSFENMYVVQIISFWPFWSPRNRTLHHVE